MNTSHIDLVLARYSDWAFTSAMVVLVIAMLLLAVELASSRARTPAEAELVSAGGVRSDSATPGVVLPAQRRTLGERVGRAGLALVYLGIALLLACIVFRGAATLRPPWGNMYEFINLTCFSGLVAAAVALRRPDLGRLAPGSKADLIVVDFDRPHIGQQIDPIQTLLLAGHGRDVRHVMVDGRWSMFDGVIPGVDEAADKRRAQAQFERLMALYPVRTWGHPPVEDIFSSAYPVVRGPVVRGTA